MSVCFSLQKSGNGRFIVLKTEPVEEIGDRLRASKSWRTLFWSFHTAMRNTSMFDSPLKKSFQVSIFCLHLHLYNIKDKSYFHLESHSLTAYLILTEKTVTVVMGVNTQVLSLGPSGGSQGLQLPEVVLREAASSPHSGGLWGSCSQTSE